MLVDCKILNTIKFELNIFEGLTIYTVYFIFDILIDSHAAFYSIK